MEKTMQRKFMKVCAIAAATFFIGTSSFAGGPNDTGTVGSSDVNGTGNPSLGGTATVYRGAAGIGMNAYVTGLRGGFPYTVWAVVFNSPQNCLAFPGPCGPADFGVEGTPSQPRVTQIARNYADDSGDSFFSGFLPVGASLFNAQRAEVHFVYRRHPDVDGGEYVSLNMVGGNCEGEGDLASNCQDEGFSMHKR
jgi:hypothetical protein